MSDKNMNNKTIGQYNQNFNIIYLASAACKSLRAPSFLILTLSPEGYPRFKHFSEKKSCYR